MVSSGLGPAAMVAVFACAGVVGSATAQERSGAAQERPDAIDRVLAPEVRPELQSEVMVLGTVHLSAYGDRVRPDQVESLLRVLEGWRPTRIAVENLSADEVALLVEREAHDPAAKQVLDLFARRAADLGLLMQRERGVDRIAAARHAETLLEDGRSEFTPAERVELVAHLLAAFELNSAALQWSYLTPEARAAAHVLPEPVREALDRRVGARNEIRLVALALARRLGLQRIDPIDSQYDGIRTLAMPADAIEALFADPAQEALRDAAERARGEDATAAAFEAGDLLPLYRYVNGREYLEGDATQWRWLLRGSHASGLDRFRYAMWELRNLRQATRIADVAASTRPERVLVLVGAAHKAPLERILRTQLGVRLVDLADIAKR